ncbi:2-C-methyl-D-erythritol 2,4-cyclodiphosphate synthase [Spiroplasma sp. BIUS-1]|uniref:2-C-methyl-D-erythritol 2,4-cyclodiphosphate synthase n=1 Tax=Spiroplasma sp. BIUS-1 TaxID=216964 RepID=UPI001398556E|nr:2-C-methyl-D-erythritol 2,4-cyclodiphosphate synthase [Spiroplasma sp. BIUS-1]QHX37060.1 2-C-methyl-D-erythritol 2 [Spiroplasma sp. BIUS-1]
MKFRTGFSKDMHNLVDGNKIILAGIEIKSNKSVEAYSDGDVVFHSLVEALLGSMGKEDLGENYNPNNMEKNFSSLIMVEDVKKLLHENHYIISNIDILIELDSPKLKEFKKNIKDNISKILNLELDQISVKATTTEGNFTNIITSYCNVLIYKDEVK